MAGFLYKYRTIDDAHLERVSRIFTHNELWFSRSRDFNDPFDCKFQLSYDSTDKQKKDYLGKTFGGKNPGGSNRSSRRFWARQNIGVFDEPDFKRGMEEGLDEIIAGIGIYSLSKVCDDLLMWAHYASAHTGLCIEFRDLGFISRALEVTYSNQYPTLNRIIEGDLACQEKMLLTKSSHWKYEEEWRIIDYEDGPGVKSFPGQLLTGVIFGCRMSKDHEHLVREWCKDRDPRVTFQRMQQAPTSYELEIVDG